MKFYYIFFICFLIFNKYPSPRWIEICNSSNQNYYYNYTKKIDK